MKYPERKFLMSIRPVFSQRIFNGEKQCEFRKSFPRVFPEASLRVYIYETAPTKMVVGEFVPQWIQRGTPSFLWNSIEPSGITKKEFFSYFKGYEDKKVVALDARSAVRFSKPLPLSRFGVKKPPQSYCEI